MSLVFKNSVLYLHSPNTGGNWPTQMAREQGLVLGKLGHKHATYDYLAPHPGRFGGLRALVSGERAWKHLSAAPKVLCGVRNPLSWYESWFKYQISKDWRDWGTEGDLSDWHVCAALNTCKDTDFLAFMRDVNRNVPGFVTGLFARYTHGAKATAPRNESLAQDFVEFAERTGSPVDRAALLSAGRIGESPKTTLHWDEDVLRETVRNAFPAFHSYGYEAPKVRAARCFVPERLGCAPARTTLRDA